MITLHGGPTPNARKVAIALYEMDLPWRLQPVDILAGAVRPLHHFVVPLPRCAGEV